MIRKITFLAVFAFSSSALFAQHGKTFTGVGTDTLLYQTFNFTNWTVISSPNMPPSVKNDTAWYTYDAAMLELPPVRLIGSRLVLSTGEIQQTMWLWLPTPGLIRQVRLMTG
jgi:hypothetical protein